MKKLTLLGSSIVMYLLALPGLAYGQDKSELELKKNAPMINNLFIENKGQVTGMDYKPVNGVLYSASLSNARIYFFKDHISYVMSKVNNDGTHNQATSSEVTLPKTKNVDMQRVDLIFENANPSVEVKGMDKSAALITYNNSSSASVHDAESFHKILYTNIYPDIDVEFYFKDNVLEYDFIVHANGDINQIRYRYEGGESISLINSKQLNIDTKLGVLTEAIPESYITNTRTGERKDVSVSYNMKRKNIMLKADHPVNLQKDEILVIDPTLTYHSMLGASTINGETFALDVDVNNMNDDYYLAGYTKATNYPLTAGWSPQPGGANIIGGLYDGFVARYNSAGVLQSFTYIGGAGDDFITAIKVTDVLSTMITVTGATNSNSFISASRAVSRTDFDAFILQYRPSPSALMFCQYFGDIAVPATGIFANQFAYTLETDNWSRSFIGGFSDGNELPYTIASYLNPYATAGFVAVFDGVGANVACRRVGDMTTDFKPTTVTDLWFDKGTGSMIVTGHTLSGSSLTFEPTIPAGALQTINNGGIDVFALRLHMSLAPSVVLSNLTPAIGTFLGGAGNDTWPRVAMFNNIYTEPTYPNIYLTYTTASNNMDVLGYTSAASYKQFFATLGGPNFFDAFVSVLNNTLTTHLFGSYIGGGGNGGLNPAFEQACDIGVDKFNNFYVYGISSERSWGATTFLTNPTGAYIPAMAAETHPAYFLIKFRPTYALDFMTFTGSARTPAASPAGYALQWNSGIFYNEISKICFNNCNDQLYLSGSTYQITSSATWPFTHAYVRKVSIGTCGQSWKTSTGTDDAEHNGNHTIAYPNPAKDVLNLTFKGEVTSIEVMDITGRVVYSNNNPGKAGYVQVNSSEWKPGIYLVKTYNGSEVTVSEKIVKE